MVTVELPRVDAATLTDGNVLQAGQERPIRAASCTSVFSLTGLVGQNVLDIIDSQIVEETLGVKHDRVDNDFVQGDLSRAALIVVVVAIVKARFPRDARVDKARA